MPQHRRGEGSGQAAEVQRQHNGPSVNREPDSFPQDFPATRLELGRNGHVRNEASSTGGVGGNLKEDPDLGPRCPNLKTREW